MVWLHKTKIWRKSKTVLYGFIVYIKKDNPYKVISRDFETKFDTSNSTLDKSLSKNVIGLIKD